MPVKFEVRIWTYWFWTAITHRTLFTENR